MIRDRKCTNSVPLARAFGELGLCSKTFWPAGKNWGKISFLKFMVFTLANWRKLVKNGVVKNRVTTALANGAKISGHFRAASTYTRIQGFFQGLTKHRVLEKLGFSS